MHYELEITYSNGSDEGLNHESCGTISWKTKLGACRRIPSPSVNDIADGRGVLVKVLRVGIDGTLDTMRERSGHGMPADWGSVSKRVMVSSLCGRALL